MAGTEDWGDIRNYQKQSEGGRERRWMSLAFADDLVSVTKSERHMKESGKVREEEKAGSECWEDESDGVQWEEEE
jgi:hypothetical protein